MNKRGHTTTFIVNGADFFVALTDADTVRIGMVGGTCWDIPRGHAWYERVTECVTEAEAEGYFDELMDARVY